jgi:hypothetical protein
MGEKMSRVQSHIEIAKLARPVPNNVPYIIAVVVMAVIGVVAVVAITIARPDKDNTAVYAIIFSSLTPTTLALLAFMKSQETHLAVNSRLDQFIENADRAARSEGELVGRAAGRESANERTDVLKRQEDGR